MEKSFDMIVFETKQSIKRQLNATNLPLTAMKHMIDEIRTEIINELNTQLTNEMVALRKAQAEEAQPQDETKADSIMGGTLDLGDKEEPKQ